MILDAYGRAVDVAPIPKEPRDVFAERMLQGTWLYWSLTDSQRAEVDAVISRARAKRLAGEP